MVEVEKLLLQYEIDANFAFRRTGETFVHPTAVIGKGVKLGKGCYVGPYCIIQGNVKIGERNVFEAHVSIGSPAEHKGLEFNRLLHAQKGAIEIGNDNQFKEFITINLPTKDLTKIGNRNFIMRGCHISHDTEIQDDVIMSCNVLLGGHSLVMQGAYLSLGCITHPKTIIGPYAMLGMGAIATKTTEIKPWRIYVGSPAKFLKMNKVGASRADLNSKLYYQHCRLYTLASES